MNEERSRELRVICPKCSKNSGYTITGEEPEPVTVQCRCGNGIPLPGHFKTCLYCGTAYYHPENNGLKYCSVEHALANSTGKIMLAGLGIMAGSIIAASIILILVPRLLLLVSGCRIVSV
ncbi:MAG: hypothetical protein ACFFD4_21835 [Candidatus Odinarchaeota archaeon]